MGFSSLAVLPTTIRIDYYYKDGDVGWQLSPCAVSHRKIRNSLVGNSIKKDFRFLIRELPFHSIGSFSQRMYIYFVPVTVLSTGCVAMNNTQSSASSHSSKGREIFIYTTTMHHHRLD